MIDPRQGAAFDDAGARAIEPSGLQRAQAAVRGLLLVERDAAAEVRCFDERHAEAAARCLIREREPVNAASDDGDIERAGLEPARIAWVQGRTGTL